jgi:hypothetical protein
MTCAVAAAVPMPVAWNVDRWVGRMVFGLIWLVMSSLALMLPATAARRSAQLVHDRGDSAAWLSWALYDGASLVGAGYLAGGAGAFALGAMVTGDRWPLVLAPLNFVAILWIFPTQAKLERF